MACFQVTVGLGNPSAWHCSTTDLPSTTLSSAGSTNHRGGTAGNKKKGQFLVERPRSEPLFGP
jgi:hypothetical protein